MMPIGGRASRPGKARQYVAGCRRRVKQRNRWGNEAVRAVGCCACPVPDGLVLKFPGRGKKAQDAPTRIGRAPKATQFAIEDVGHPRHLRRKVIQELQP